MANATLSAALRTDTGKGAARALRREGRVPGIIYGHAREPQPLSLDARELGRLLEHVTESTVIEVSIDGKPAKTLIREIQRHPFKKHFVHVDFQELVAGESVVVRIPLVFRGVAEGVKVDAGIMNTLMTEFEVEADPSNIPDHIDVDVTHVTIGHALHVGEIPLPAGVTVLDDPESAVVIVSAPKATELTPVEAMPAIPAEPELIRKPKGEDEE
jgi:large subunit ribosomal protein L25